MNVKSLWMEELPARREYPALRGGIDTDTAVVGGGLAGILCAYALKERGVDCVVVEAKRIGSGVTKNTTAKITAQHGLVYSRIEREYGLEAAKEYLAVNQEAVEKYRRLARHIPCDFEEKTAYVYSRGSRQRLEDEAAVYRRMGLEAAFLKNPPIPLKTAGALGMEHQAQFHPMKFLTAVAEGLKIYENTAAVDIRPGVVVTDKGSVKARRIVLATHYPMVNIPGLYVLKLYQRRSYVLALSGAPDPQGLYIDEREDGLSFRSQGEYLLLGGCGHRTGQRGGGWTELRRAAGALYPEAKERYAWATQDCMTLDALPYIGWHRRNSRELYVAAGFNKWGMTGAMAAAEVLGELIAEGSSRYAGLFNPSRSMRRPQLLANVGTAVGGLFSLGKRCPHMGCALKWNPQEHTWDCPCHGSRFEKNGDLIDNPAKRGRKLG